MLNNYKYSIDERQIEIMERHVKGETERSIALNMGISINTVRYHKKKLFKSLSVNNLASAVSILKDANLL